MGPIGGFYLEASWVLHLQLYILFFLRSVRWKFVFIRHFGRQHSANTTWASGMSFGTWCHLAFSTAVLGRTAFGSPNSIYLSNPKNGHQTNRTVQWHHLAHLAVSCGVVWSHKVGTLSNPFPIVNRVSAGVPTRPDSGKTPQLKTSKMAQNCGKTEVLHLQPSYGICWGHEIETLPPM